MSRPTIVADAAIPFAREALGELGDVALVPGPAIDRARVLGARFLAIRTATRADAALLAGSKVELVASATAGFDHVDAAGLAGLGIGWVHAPGCNAASVGEWVAAALALVAARRGISLAGRRLGIVGAGHTGSAAARLARALGMEVLYCDPPRARGDSDHAYLELDRLIELADAVSLHVPLIRAGTDATVGLIGAARLEGLAGKVLLNASRGEIVDASALAKRASALGGLALDVWPAEPAIDATLLQACDVASPHVAGYSLEGKARATAAVHAAFARALGRQPSWSPGLPNTDAPPIHVERRGRPTALALAELVARAHPLAHIDAALRVAIPADATSFEAMRAGAARRREFSATPVSVERGDAALVAGITSLGFRLAARA